MVKLDQVSDWKILILVLIFILSPVVVSEFANISSIAEDHESLVTLFFSGLLVILYYLQYKQLNEQVKVQTSNKEIAEKQSNIIERQTKIMESQKEWMEYEHKPELSVDQWVIEGKEGQSSLTITNFGNGSAEKLTLEIRFKPKEKIINDSGYELPRSGSPDRLPDEFQEKREIQFLYEKNSEGKGRSSRSIEPDQRAEYISDDEFVSILVDKEHGGSAPIDIEKYFDRMSDYNVDFVEFMVGLEYKIPGRETKTQDLYGGHIAPQEYTSVADLIKDPANPILPYHNISPEFDINE